MNIKKQKRREKMLENALVVLVALWVFCVLAFCVTLVLSSPVGP